MLANSERNYPLKPESRQNSPDYAESADAIANKSAMISIIQFGNNPAPCNYRHRQPGWLEPAAGTYDLQHPIELNASDQTADKRLLISSSADNWTQKLGTKDTKKSPRAKPLQPLRIIAKKTRIGCVSRGSTVSQLAVNIIYASRMYLRMDRICVGEIDKVFNDTSRIDVFHYTYWAKVFNDTSWAEVFTDTFRIYVFHNTSCVVNFSIKFLRSDKDDGYPRYEVYNVPSTQQTFGHVIKFTPSTTTSSGRSQTDGREHSGSRLQAARFTSEPTQSSGLRPTRNR